LTKSDKLTRAEATLPLEQAWRAVRRNYAGLHQGCSRVRRARVGALNVITGWLT